MTLKGGTSQACAACKYQRKRCTPECALAPHFRPEQTDIFKNAHRLFGVRNILRILEQVDPALKNEAMRTIIYQANMRERAPVHGCLGVIYQLQLQIRQAEKELYAVLSQLQHYKQHHHQRRQHEITLSPIDSPESQQQLQLGMGLDQQQSLVNNPGLTLFQNEAPLAAFQISYAGNDNVTDHGYHNNNNNNNNHNHNHNYNHNHNHNNNSSVINNIDHAKDNMNMTNAMWGQQTYYHDNNDKAQMVNTQQLTFQEEVTHDYDEIYPFFDTIDDTQSYIDSKEANESSSESSLKEPTQSVDRFAANKLKNAQLQLGIVSEDYQTFA